MKGRIAEFAIYTIFTFNGITINEIIYCDVTEEEATPILNKLRCDFPERTFYLDEIKTSGIFQVNLN